jgi:hypothetical protein
MLRTSSRVIVLTAVLAGPTAQAAEPTRLMLACKGTVTIKGSPIGDYDPDPVSMGLIVNFTTRTVQGTSRWGPHLFDDQLQITDWNEWTVVFSGFSKFLGTDIHGSMDRVTGDVNMISTAEGQGFLHDIYSLKCRPTERSF